MRRVEPAYPDLFPVTHVQRPGYLPGTKVSLDPIKLGIVWEDAPRRILPAEGSVPREAIRAISFARVARERNEILHRSLDRGGSVLIVLDDPEITPADLGLDSRPGEQRVSALLPVLPFPLSDGLKIPTAWKDWRWGAVLGLFPFPGAGPEVERRIKQLKKEGAGFAVAAQVCTDRIKHDVWRQILDRRAHVVPARITNGAHRFQLGIEANVAAVPQVKLKRRCDGPHKPEPFLPLLLDIERTWMMHKVGAVHKRHIAIATGSRNTPD